LNELEWPETPMRILSIFGTRPEAIKLAPVIRELERWGHRGLQSVVCVTAQHRQMLDQVLHLFGIKPSYDLDVMEGNQTPAQVAAAVLARLEPVLQEVRPTGCWCRATRQRWLQPRWRRIMLGSG